MSSGIAVASSDGDVDIKELKKELRNIIRNGKSMEALRAACDLITFAEEGDIRSISSLHFRMILCYYEDVRNQASKSFRYALLVALVGAVVLMAPMGLMLLGRDVHTMTLSLVGGGVIEFISCINFALYYKAARQFSTFHVCLERMGRFLLAETLCENLKKDDSPEQTKMRSKLIKVIAEAPLLTFGIKNACEPPSSERMTERDGDNATGSVYQDSKSDSDFQRSHAATD